VKPEVRKRSLEVREDCVVETGQAHLKERDSSVPQQLPKSIQRRRGRINHQPPRRFIYLKRRHDFGPGERVGGREGIPYDDYDIGVEKPGQELVPLRRQQCVRLVLVLIKTRFQDHWLLRTVRILVVGVPAGDERTAARPAHVREIAANHPPVDAAMQFQESVAGGAVVPICDRHDKARVRPTARTVIRPRVPEGRLEDAIPVERRPSCALEVRARDTDQRIEMLSASTFAVEYCAFYENVQLAPKGRHFCRLGGIRHAWFILPVSQDSEHVLDRHTFVRRLQRVPPRLPEELIQTAENWALLARYSRACRSLKTVARVGTPKSADAPAPRITTARAMSSTDRSTSHDGAQTACLSKVNRSGPLAEVVAPLTHRQAHVVGAAQVLIPTPATASRASPSPPHSELPPDPRLTYHVHPGSTLSVKRDLLACDVAHRSAILAEPAIGVQPSIARMRQTLPAFHGWTEPGAQIPLKITEKRRVPDIEIEIVAVGVLPDPGAYFLLVQ
jgi:hypothetical protein